MLLITGFHVSTANWHTDGPDTCFDRRYPRANYRLSGRKYYPPKLSK